MVNMVGFHHKEPSFNTAAYGEPGWFIRIRRMPTDAHPLRAVVTTPCMHAAFNTPNEARDFLDHPGDVWQAAQFYLAETKEQANGDA